MPFAQPYFPQRTKQKKRRAIRAVSLALPYPGFPLASFLHPLRSTASQWLVIPILLLVAFLLRWAVGLGAYSGLESLPMHGDFEAQRHWMEITTQLPMKDWYWHDLEWWGLDYPPLTAYHSWLIGAIGNLVRPSWFELHTSRGLDDPKLKFFMRATVVISEYITYVPAMVVFVRVYGKLFDMSVYEKAVSLAAILIQPSLMIIDHGHFQYNSVMFGLTYLAVDCFLTDHLLFGSLFFVLALTFKQMALYYAPVIFAYLLGLSVFPRLHFQRLFLLGVTVIATFTLILAPLVASGGFIQISQCLSRIFPFSRGLWEDKVANFWCASNVIVKYRQRFSGAILQQASMLATFVAIFPSCVIIFLYPRKRLLPIGMSACAWGFFLFSFQVHEKSVLLPLVPATSFLAGSLDSENIVWVTWMNNIALFSMWPLLNRDGLALQYAVLFILFGWLMGTFQNTSDHWAGKMIHIGSYVAVLAIHIAEKAIGQPERYPDIWVVGNVLISFACYVIAWGWTLLKLWQEARTDKDKND
ncbi:glycosyl transferase [Geopyxis carbonaria]|nr:glycosyl transferase [Geopyxis carbonaria]